MFYPAGASEVVVYYKLQTLCPAGAGRDFSVSHVTNLVPLWGMNDLKITSLASLTSLIVPILSLLLGFKPDLQKITRLLKKNLPVHLRKCNTFS